MSRLITVLLLGCCFFGDVYASDDHGHEEKHEDSHKEERHDDHDEHSDEHSGEHSSEEGHIKLSAEQAIKSGISSVLADAGEIKQTITVYGKSVTSPSAISHIHARFPGMITQLKGNIGDLIKAGEVVAEVESNQSLKRYNITAPISGVVTSRNGNPGELADEQALLTLANYSQLWVEYQIFPSQSQQIAIGQTVTITAEHQQTESVIKQLMPGHLNQPFTIARVALDNTQGQWSPGLLLSGTVVVNQVQVPLVVDNRAIQMIEGKSVVFVKNDQGYETRPLTFGQTDGHFTEVIEGLTLGEQYAVENSYLLKADLEKASAAHHH